MTTTTLTLAQFLLARLEAEEAAALAATPGPWKSRPYWFDQVHEGDVLAGDARLVREVDLDDAAHIAAWDPARVLAQVAATRAIVGACRPDYEESLASNDDTTPLAEEVLRHLAAPYASHPDWREEWVVS